VSVCPDHRLDADDVIGLEIGHVLVATAPTCSANMRSGNRGSRRRSSGNWRDAFGPAKLGRPRKLSSDAETAL
jgi:hypothetical protein